jgi:hypothetical protein
MIGCCKLPLGRLMHEQANLAPLSELHAVGYSRMNRATSQDREDLRGIEASGENRGIDVYGLTGYSVSDDRNSPDHHAGGFDPTKSFRQISKSLTDLLAWPLCHWLGRSC